MSEEITRIKKRRGQVFVMLTILVLINLVIFTGLLLNLHQSTSLSFTSTDVYDMHLAEKNIKQQIIELEDVLLQKYTTTGGGYNPTRAFNDLVAQLEEIKLAFMELGYTIELSVNPTSFVIEGVYPVDRAMIYGEYSLNMSDGMISYSEEFLINITYHKTYTVNGNIATIIAHRDVNGMHYPDAFAIVTRTQPTTLNATSNFDGSYQLQIVAGNNRVVITYSTGVLVEFQIIG